MKKKNLLYIVCALAMSSLCGCDDFWIKTRRTSRPMTLIGRLKLLCVLMRKTSILPTLQDMVPTILFCRLFLWR